MLRLVPWTVAEDSVGDAILVTPSTALLGGRTYGVIVTRDVRSNRASIGRSSAFSARAGLPNTRALVEAAYSEDPEAPGNPYPEDRLVRGDGTIRVPDRFVLRGVSTGPKLDEARAALRRGADELEALSGFSTTAPIRIEFDGPVDLDSVRPNGVALFERTDGGLDLEGLLAMGEQLGIAGDNVALAFSFPTQPIEADLVSVQAVLRDRASRVSDPVTFQDPDPDDALRIGVFDRSDPELQDFFADAPAVGRLAVGLLRSPDFRDESGLWTDARVAGEEAAPEAELDFRLTLPAAGEPPYPVVLLQHGFGGSNAFVTDLGPELAELGVAAIGINAVSHGSRGSALDLLRARPFRARDLFRQSIADLMAVLRAIEVGIDVDGDGSADLDPNRMSYLGVSFGGALGATLVAVEEILPVAVLNVAGGRVAFFGQSDGVRDLVSGELAAEVGLTADDPDFEPYLQRILEVGQHAMDPADGLNFARRWFLEPFQPGITHRVLIQMGIGDDLVQNESTEALAEAGGLRANFPMRDPDGVSGLWRFEPPGGHGILAREDVRAQAFRFLESDGTEIIDPSTP